MACTDLECSMLTNAQVATCWEALYRFESVTSESLIGTPDDMACEIVFDLQRLEAPMTGAEPYRLLRTA
jgi:hypothetical protein